MGSKWKEGTGMQGGFHTSVRCQGYGRVFFFPCKVPWMVCAQAFKMQSHSMTNGDRVSGGVK